MKGYSQVQIARQLEISQPTVQRDLQDTKDRFCRTKKEYYDLEIERSLKSIYRKDLISKELWCLVEDKETTPNQKIRSLLILAKLDNRDYDPTTMLCRLRSKGWEEQENPHLHSIIIPQI